MRNAFRAGLAGYADFGAALVRHRGERTASAMESQLTQLEKKIDELLASVDDVGQQDADPATGTMAIGDASGSGSGSAPRPGGPGGAKDESE